MYLRVPDGSALPLAVVVLPMSELAPLEAPANPPAPESEPAAVPNAELIP